VDDVAGALRRRGIAAEAQVVEDAHPSAHEVMRLAAQTAADLVVCGAYGHSRLGEWVFGGFTFDLLQHDEAYVLFSH